MNKIICKGITSKNEKCKYKASIDGFCKIHYKKYNKENKIKQELCDICYIECSDKIVCSFCKFECCKTCYMSNINSKQIAICLNSDCKKQAPYYTIIKNLGKQYITKQYNTIYKSLLQDKYIKHLNDVQNDFDYIKECFFLTNGSFDEKMYFTATKLNDIDEYTKSLNKLYELKLTTKDTKYIKHLNSEIDNLYDMFNNIHTELSEIWYSLDLIYILDVYIYDNLNNGKYTYKKNILYDKPLVSHKKNIYVFIEDLYTQEIKNYKEKLNYKTEYYSYNLLKSNLIPTNNYFYYRISALYDPILHMLINNKEYRNEALKLSNINDTKILKLKLEKIKSNSYNTQNRYIMKCTKNCKGLITVERFKCSSCQTEYCKTCYKELNHEHKCDEKDVVNIKEINSISKPCPTCTTRISKSAGCDQMFCIECKTVFNWITLELEKGPVHNPLYIEWKKSGTENKDKKDIYTKLSSILSSTTYEKTIEIYRYYTDLSYSIEQNFNNTEILNKINSYRRLLLHNVETLNLIDNLYKLSRKLELNTSILTLCIPNLQKIISYIENIDSNITIKTINKFISDIIDPTVITFIEIISCFGTTNKSILNYSKLLKMNI